MDFKLSLSLSLAVSGVLYVHVHGAKHLLVNQQHSRLPSVSPQTASSSVAALCTVRSSDKTILTTRCVSDTTEPVWEQGTELFIAKYKAVSWKYKYGGGRYMYISSNRSGEVSRVVYLL